MASLTLLDNSRFANMKYEMIILLVTDALPFLIADAFLYCETDSMLGTVAKPVVIFPFKIALFFFL